MHAPPTPQAAPHPAAMTSYRQELEKYRDIDEDKILQELSAEELEQLDTELLEMDPEVRPGVGTAQDMGGGPGRRGSGSTHGCPPVLPQNVLLPAGLRQRDQTQKSPTGPLDREALLQHLEKQALEAKEREDLVPFTGEKKGGGTPWGDGAPQHQVYLAWRHGAHQQLRCPGRVGPPPAPGMATPRQCHSAGNATPPPTPPHHGAATPHRFPSPAAPAWHGGHRDPGVGVTHCRGAVQDETHISLHRETLRAQKPDTGDPPRGADHAGAGAGGGVGQRHRG